MNENIITEECPICKMILTSWSIKQNSQWVCDVCGFGKNSMDEYELLQKIVEYREKYFEYSWMKNSESCYSPRSLLKEN